MTVPRGLRNNNPLNIRKSASKWQGEIEGDPVFETFDCMEDGIRAAAKILIRYFKVYNLATIEDIIARWAPKNENNTEAYIETVSKVSGFEKDEYLNLLDASILGSIIRAMAAVELGKDYLSNTQLAGGVRRALEV